MDLTILAGSSNRSLAEAVASRLGTALGRVGISRFPDGELHLEVQQSIRGDDVFLVQSTSPPVDSNLLEILLLADACRRAGAARLTAVIPYVGYARQDRRATGREPVSARVVADLLQVSGIQRVVAVDLHSPVLEGFFWIPFEHLTAVPTLAGVLRPLVTSESVIVAPDLGAAKLADTYARLLHLPVAIVHKTRVSGEAVSVTGVTGEVRGRAPVIVDDMISTGGTVEAAIRSLLTAGCQPDITVVATHALLIGSALQRLGSLPVRRLIVSDSVELPTALSPLIHPVSLGPLLAEAIGRLHRGESLEDLLVHR
jgi:ribose-phosphate pyrophosphokinase